MNLTLFNNAAAFLDKAQLWLEAREAENNLILGIAILLHQEPDRFKNPPFMAVVTEVGNLVNAAIMTPPFNLVLAGQPQPTSLGSLASGMIEQGWSPPGVVGPKETSRAFAPLWSKYSGRNLQAGIKMRLYELTWVIQPAPLPGRLREAWEEEIPLITDWVIAFQQEALNQSISREDALRHAERLVAQQKLFFWDDGGPVSMAVSARPTRNGVSINQVYTPPEQRRKGYASACVAALSQRLLDSGYKFCCLATDLANPTSNRIYMEIGYQPICDFDEYRFVDVATDQSPGRTG